MMHTFERYFHEGQGLDFTDQMAFTLLREVMANAPVALAHPDDYDARANLMWCGTLSHNGLMAVGNATKIKVVKNKVAPPFKTATVNIIYGEGISKADEVINLAVENDIIMKAGAWFSYEGDKIGQGFQSVREYFKNHPEFAEKVTEQVKEKLFPKPETEEKKEA
jgi:hypothetical protein